MAEEGTENFAISVAHKLPEFSGAEKVETKIKEFLDTIEFYHDEFVAADRPKLFKFITKVKLVGVAKIKFGSNTSPWGSPGTSYGITKILKEFDQADEKTYWKLVTEISIPSAICGLMIMAGFYCHRKRNLREQEVDIKMTESNSSAANTASNEFFQINNLPDLDLNRELNKEKSRAEPQPSSRPSVASPRMSYSIREQTRLVHWGRLVRRTREALRGNRVLA